MYIRAAVVLVCLGFMPWSGVMPWGCKPLELSSGVWWWPPSFSFLPPWWWKVEDAGSGKIPLNKLVLVLWCSLIWRASNCYCLFSQATMVVDEKQDSCRILKFIGRVRAYQQRSLWWSDGAHRWLPVFVGALFLLAEWRLTIFLPACVPDGRQFQWRLGGYGEQVMLPWRFRRAKWFVPGDGEVQSGRRLSRTRSRFLLSVWGPPCKSQGLNVMFLSILVLL